MSVPQADYDKLYAEWRTKNDACNTAYAITIPRLKKLLTDMVTAWESLPGGTRYDTRVIEKWLMESMSPVINDIRAGLRSL